MQVKKGSENITVYFHLRDSADGTSKTGLTFESAGAIASYIRSQAARVNIPLITLAAADSVHADGGFVEVDGTNAKGLYRLDVPDAAVATGVNDIIIHIGFTGVFEESLAIELVDELSSDLKEGIDSIENALVSAVGTTTDAGNAGGTTVIDTDRTEITGFWNSLSLKLTSGACNGQLRTITGYDSGTHTLTVFPAFTAQITSGVTYRILTSIVYQPGILIVPNNNPIVTVDTSSILALSIITNNGRPALGDLTEGTVTINRIRAGVTTAIVTTAACSKWAGDIYYTYEFPAESWQAGDNYQAIMIDQAVTVNGATYEFPYTVINGYVISSDMALESSLTAIKGAGWTTETLKAINDALTAEVGPGALSCTYTVLDSEDNPLDNVAIWITTDEAGVNVIAGTLYTDAAGEAIFMLDAGTYYVWCELAGYNFTNPQEWTVS